jgi:hypothetical protein
MTVRNDDIFKQCLEDYEKFMNIHGKRPRVFITDPELFSQYLVERYDLQTRYDVQQYLKQRGVVQAMPG